ncbi:unnamed protein product [Brassica oleracea var. botrytis]
MSKEEAMEQYLALVSEEIPGKMPETGSLEDMTTLDTTGVASSKNKTSARAHLIYYNGGVVYTFALQNASYHYSIVNGRKLPLLYYCDHHALLPSLHPSALMLLMEKPPLSPADTATGGSSRAIESHRNGSG